MSGAGAVVRPQRRRVETHTSWARGSERAQRPVWRRRQWRRRGEEGAGAAAAAAAAVAAVAAAAAAAAAAANGAQAQSQRRGGDAGQECSSAAPSGVRRRDSNECSGGPRARAQSRTSRTMRARSLASRTEYHFDRRSLPCREISSTKSIMAAAARPRGLREAARGDARARRASECASGCARVCAAFAQMRARALTLPTSTRRPPPEEDEPAPGRYRARQVTSPLTRWDRD